jgi:aerobic carbon-monoxide dehydrogenase medium subunit
MKPARFDYAVATTLDDAIALMAENPNAKIIAGGQTLGPMLNLRLVQPELVIDITRIPELSAVEEEADWVSYGACVTHAAIEDGRVPDRTAGALPRIARGIAYRAVRTRGTIGGSLAHADPAADWLSALIALGAEVIAYDGKARRAIALNDLMTGVFETAIGDHEILTEVRIPRLSKDARFGYYKICRKTGEFAEAIGAVLSDPARGIFRGVVGATEGAPIVLDDLSALTTKKSLDPTVLKQALQERGLDDAYELQLHTVALQRAAVEALT